MMKSHTRWSRFLFVAALAPLVVTHTFADDYLDARAELVAAYQAQDYDAMVAAAHASLGARPGYPGALFNLALAEVLSGDSDASLHTLNTLLTRGVDFGAFPLHVLIQFEHSQQDRVPSREHKLISPAGATFEASI